jgi:surface carbohydrate biosynthesis protein
MKFSSIPKAFSYLRHSKLVWHKPKEAKVLIFDRDGSEALLTYLDEKSVHIMDIRGESLNLYVLIKCLSQGILSLSNYCVQYLTCVKPEVALTFIDNNHIFYQFKSHLKDLTTVFVQNGLRSGEIFRLLKAMACSHNTYQVHYMLTFGNAVGRKYSEYIEGKIYPIGSFKNNLFQPKTKIPSKSVLFLSQYRPPPNPESKPMWIEGNRAIFWKQLYSAEAFLLPLLKQYCLNKRLELKICLCSTDETKEEFSYFRSLVGDGTLEALRKDGIYSSYEKIIDAGFVVFVDSTLGYEALARGKKAAAFTLRGKYLESGERNFGWPAILPDRGPFWTIHASEREFERVMNYVTTVSDEEWEQTCQRYVPELIEYDPGNSRFLKLMREIGVPLKREYQNNV